jgi:hypothetical protein
MAKKSEDTASLRRKAAAEKKKALTTGKLYKRVTPKKG